MTTEDQAWVPDACTLPTVQRPLRLAEFDDLFATALRGQQRLSATTLAWNLDLLSEPVARDLADRESSYCSFFSFSFHVSDGGGRRGAGRARGGPRRPGRAGGRRDPAVTGLRSSQVADAVGVNL